jgi:RNA polymerase sigma-70 factor, ECF subfamily
MSAMPSGPPRRLRALKGGQEAELDDEDIIAAVLAGDESVAGELHRRLLGVVDHTLYRVMGGREQDHDDLVQATFEQIVGTIARGRFARACSLRTWASTLAAHVGFKALRSRRRERAVFDRREIDHHTAAAQGDLEADASVRADIERLRDQMARMNPRRAEVVFLREVLGHDLAEITVMLGLSLAAAQSLLTRGRRELANALDPSRKESRP